MACRGLVCVRTCACVCVCGWKNGKDIGMTIRKSIVMSFLPCLVAFLAFHPYNFFKCFLLLVSAAFWVGGGGGGGGEKAMDRCGCTAQLHT